MNKIIKTYLIVVTLIIAIGFTFANFTDGVGVTGNSFATGIWNPGKATISEVFYNAVGVDTGKEWIEITNSGGYSLDMTGYVLHIDTGGTNDFIFPSFTLNSGSKVVVHVNTIGTNTASDLFWNNGLNMGNSYGSVGLFKSLPKDSTTIVDYVEYGSAGHDGEPKAVGAGIWTVGTFVPSYSTEDHSMELIGPDNNQVSDWHEQASPTPGT